MNFDYVPLFEPANLPLPPKEIIDEIMSIVSTYEFEQNQSHLREDEIESMDFFWPKKDDSEKSESRIKSNKQNLREVEKEILKTSNVDWDKCLGLPITEVNKYTDNCCFFVYLDASTPKIWKWVQDNIPYKIETSSVFIIHGGSQVVPHRDFGKNQFNLILECNDDAYNCLYEPKEEFKHLETNAYSFVPYERLNVVQKKKLEKNEWYFFPCDRLHSVENIKGRRIIFSLYIDSTSIK